MRPINILLIGDRSDSVIAHSAIPQALRLAAHSLQTAVNPIWLPTSSIQSARNLASHSPHAFWCVPGSPYDNMEGALLAIRFARENEIPFLGTCGGFQHSLIEFARDVLNLPEADHQESNPAAATLLISKLACALINQNETITFAKDSRLSALYKTATAIEPYQCSYALNPDFQQTFAGSSLHFTAFNSDGAPRAFELQDHPFFIATLYQPERFALANQLHPLIEAFVKQALPQ